MNIVIFVVCAYILYSVNALRMNRWVATSVTAAIFQSGLLMPIVSNAAIDCQSDCFQNCYKVAPGSKDYCVSSCNEYCGQDDRTDGLSDSISSSGGETGIFGGSIDGTVTRQADQPPLKGLNIIPSSMINLGKVKSN